jgi:hypothetical protein
MAKMTAAEIVSGVLTGKLNQRKRVARDRERGGGEGQGEEKKGRLNHVGKRTNR